MKELLLLLLMATVSFLVYDDHSKRTLLEQAHGQIQQLTSERDQLRQNPVNLNVAAPNTPRTWIPVNPTPPAWFQKQLDEGSSLEMSRRHTHKGEDSTAQP